MQEFRSLIPTLEWLYLLHDPHPLPGVGVFAFLGQPRYTLHMSYQIDVYKEYPNSFLPFDSFSGMRTVPPLVAGEGTATLMTTSTTTPFSAYAAGRENRVFSLEGWFLPSTSGVTVIAGHANEGVIYDNGSIRLKIRLAAGDVEGSYVLPENRSVYWVMVYNVTSVSLYVNAEKVIELTLPASTFVHSTTSLLINSGTANIVHDSIATYYRALSSAEITRHYLLGTKVSASTDIDQANGGQPFRMIASDTGTFEDVVFDSSNWSTGLYDGTSSNEYLTSATGGTWRGFFFMGSLDSTTINSSRIAWEALGTVTVSTSLDGGTTWSTCINGGVIPGVSNLTNPGGVDVRLQLGAGAQVNRLNLTFFTSTSINSASGSRTLSFTNTAFAKDYRSHLDYPATRGAHVEGYLTIDTDKSTTSPGTGTVAGWVKLTGTTGTLIDDGTNSVKISNGNITRVGYTMYVNGAMNPSSIIANEWNYIVFTKTPNNTITTIAANKDGSSKVILDVGNLATYRSALTQAQVTSLYNENIGAAAVVINESSRVRLSEPSPAHLIYAYDWTFVTSE